jgi:DNA-directed RNA polymerase subunit RPC12/RpoP
MPRGLRRSRCWPLASRRYATASHAVRRGFKFVDSVKQKRSTCIQALAFLPASRNDCLCFVGGQPPRRLTFGRRADHAAPAGCTFPLTIHPWPARTGRGSAEPRGRGTLMTSMVAAVALGAMILAGGAAMWLRLHLRRERSCPNCSKRSALVRISRTPLQRQFGYFSPSRAYRCSRCGWKGLVRLSASQQDDDGPPTASDFDIRTVDGARPALGGGD